MNFLSPAFLIGLPLIAAPLVIHLFNRRQQKRISWGAMRFLVPAATRKRRIYTLTDLLLLLLRTAAFLFFILALARPLLPSNWLGGTIPREVILVLDGSMSMARRAGDISLFELQLQRAQTLLAGLKPSDSARVLLAAETPEWLTSGPVTANAAGIRGLGEQLAELRPSLGAADLIGAVREAAGVEASLDKSGRVILALTDGQRFGWRLGETGLWTSVRQRIEHAALPTRVGVEFVMGEAADTANLSVNRIECPRPFGAVHQPVALIAHAQNQGDSPSEPALLTWRVNGQSIGVNTVPALAPRASASFAISHEFDAAGLSEVTAGIEVKDALLLDNEASLLVEIHERLPILFVEETAQGETPDSLFFLAALGAGQGSPGGGAGEGAKWRSVFEPRVIRPQELAAAELSEFRAIIVNNTPALPMETMRRLESYVKAGGGLWVSLGARTDVAAFNRDWFRGGLGLAPMLALNAVGDAEMRQTFVSVRAANEAHPATALLSDFQRLDLDKARVYRRHPFDPFSGKDASVLLQAQAGDPVVVEKALERGRVLVQGLPLGISWSTLPLCQAYVAMIHEWLWYLAEPGLPKRNLAAGEMLAQPASAAGATGELTLPTGRVIPLEAASRGAGKGGEFRYASTRWPGDYGLKAEGQGKDGGLATRFKVARTPGESDLKAFSAEDLQRLAEFKEFRFGPSADATGQALAGDGQAEVPKHPLDGWLLASLPFLLLGEMLLGGWMTHRRYLRLTPANMGSDLAGRSDGGANKRFNAAPASRR